MRRFTSILAAGLLNFAGAFAQSDRPRFQVEAYAALFELRVTRPDGSNVHGLTRDDFLVFEKNRPRAIAFFQEERASEICLAVLVDTGSTMSQPAILTAKSLVFDLIHRLEPSDQVLLAHFDRDVHFLSELTADRRQLVEGLWNLPSGGRPGRWRRLGNLFVSDSMTGYSVDNALLKMKRTSCSDKAVLVFSAGFGNIGEATLDHVQLAGARFFAVSAHNKAGDAFSLGGDQQARKRIVRETGGIQYAAETILERVGEVRDALKNYYLLAYEPADSQEIAESKDIAFQVRGHPEYTVHAVRKTRSQSSFY